MKGASSCAVVLALAAWTTAARGQATTGPEHAPAPTTAALRPGLLVDDAAVSREVATILVTPSPAFATFARLLDRSTAGIDVVTIARLRTLGPELAGSQLSARALLLRSFGAARLSLEGAVGQAVGERTDVDFEAAAALVVRAAPMLRLGAEARARGEAEDRYETVEDLGRPVELATGALIGLDLGAVQVSALGGMAWPRGMLPSAPLAVVSTTFAF